MNWHLSTDPERPVNNAYCVVIMKMKNRYHVYMNYMYWAQEDEFRDDECYEIIGFKEIIAWIEDEELLKDFKDFSKHKKAIDFLKSRSMAMKPTQKQLSFIESICEILQVEFTGTTRAEASRFISSHIDEFELANEAYALEHEDARDRPE